MDQTTRNKLRIVVTQCRKLLEEAVAQTLQGQFGIFAGKKDEVQIEPDSRMSHLSDEDREYRRDILDHFEHIKALAYKPKEALAQLIREIAFTHLNRLCAYRMMESRGLIRESVSKGLKSQGFLFYLAEHDEDERRYNSGEQDVAYRHFLNWLGGTLSEEIGVLFSPTDPANRLYPPQRVLDDVLDLLNADELAGIWSEDEAIGWVYQYFTPKELRDQARKESQAPRNSYELAFRNQFFTPRYVVEFLTDNTLGRIWYEMRMGDSKLQDQCRYMVRRPDEVFLAASTCEGHTHYEKACGDSARMLLEAEESSFPLFYADDDDAIQRMVELAHCVSAYKTKGDRWGEWFTSVRDRVEGGDFADFSTQDLLDYLFLTCRADRHSGHGEVYLELWFAAAANEVRRRALASRAEDATQEQLLHAPQFIPHRPKKDPRELKILDPACGSGHFLLYCFDLLLTIYEEAYSDPDLGPALQQDYPTLDDLRRDIPRLILAHNLHGIDIDLRASQIAALALWLRCQRNYREIGLKKDRPKITRSNVVCAEPMPGEEQMLKEFVGQLEPKVLGQVVEVVFGKMKLAGEAGSLLKIEDDIREAVAAAKKQYVRETTQATDRKGQPLLFTQAAMDRLARKPEQSSLFDLSDITDNQFFEQAESRVIEALRSYAEKAHNGQRLQRRLFADDAVRGFAFVDLCHKRFDVVLMNPPFGDASQGSNGLLENLLSSSGRDMGCAFVAEASSRMCKFGLIGVLLTATPLFQPSFTAWRKRLLFGEQRSITVLAHLGGDVLDEATVIACALVSAEPDQSSAPFIRLPKCKNKVHELLSRIRKVSTGSIETDTFIANPQEFCRLKGAPASFWISRRFRDRLASLPPLEGNGGTSKQGLATADEFRFARAWWEVNDSRWINYSKSSEYSPFWDDPTWLLNYGDDGKELRETGRARVQGTAYFGRPGVTYPSKSVLGFNPRAHPSGAAFGHTGSVVFPSEVSPACMLGYLASRPAEYALSLLTGSLQGEAGFRPVHYEVSVVGSLAFPELSAQDQNVVSAHAVNAVQTVRSLFIHDETSRDFVGPVLADKPSLAVFASRTHQQEVDAVREVRRIQTQLDEIVAASLQLTPLDRHEIDTEFQARVPPTTGRWRAYFGVEPDEVNVSEAGKTLLSYFLGCVVGRWEVRYATGNVPFPPLCDPFAKTQSLPVGMLVSQGHQQEASTEVGCPLRIDQDGIIPDDSDHADDIVRRVREVIEVIWLNRADPIEKEACEFLGVKELRDYFRKPSKGGFWDDHISRYSKSRRKAPIYWLLQSSKKNYALWLYYHRIDKDLLFKALVNYVEPKIRLEASRLESLRSQKAAAGDSGKESKRLAKDVERQEDFLSELRDFEDKLRRAANLHLEPDLNDGVVLNIAPLHELVPWKEAKKYWNELLDGKYEWSSIGKQLREKGLVK